MKRTTSKANEDPPLYPPINNTAFLRWMFYYTQTNIRHMGQRHGIIL
jgi:hypothetical protein